MSDRFFFFKQKTAYEMRISDWSSDVCSSDLNDWSGDLDASSTPPEVFLLRRAAAMQAWYEHSPVRMRQFPYGGVPQTYRRLDFGRLMRLHVLDKRSYRSIRLCEKPGDGNCVATRDTPDTMLGDTQERWL